jgi:hypothetical protein
LAGCGAKFEGLLREIAEPAPKHVLPPPPESRRTWKCSCPSRHDGRMTSSGHRVHPPGTSQSTRSCPPARASVALERAVLLMYALTVSGFRLPRPLVVEPDAPIRQETSAFDSDRSTFRRSCSAGNNESPARLRHECRRGSRGGPSRLSILTSTRSSSSWYSKTVLEFASPSLAIPATRKRRPSRDGIGSPSTVDGALQTLRAVACR